MSAGSPQLLSLDGQWQPSFIALIWGQRPTTPDLLPALRRAIAAHCGALAERFEGDGLHVFAPIRACGTNVRAANRGSAVVIGDLFEVEKDRVAGPLTDRLAGLDMPADQVAAWVLEHGWGAYALLSRDATTGETVILRDPSGGLAVHVIDCGGAALVTDQLPEWLAKVIDRPLPVDRKLLANALAMPILTTHHSLLRNVASIAAGGVVSWGGGTRISQMAWAPHLLCREQGGAAGMRTAVLGCAAAWRGIHQRALLELSGGLDSAIMLGALAQSGGVADLKCINLATTYAAGDEREPARDAVALWSAELVEVLAREEEMDYGAHLAGPQPLQPVLYGLDPILERSVAGVATAFDSSAIFTGQGGDAVFFQLPTDRIAIDYMRAYGPSALFSPVAIDAARRTRRSIWRVQYRMLRDRIANTPPQRVPAMTALLGAGAMAMLEPGLADHPWLAQSLDLPPGRQQQLLAIANCQLFNGPTFRRGAAALIHPLMSQPVMEACLTIPTYELSHGTGDRALAREVFADLLPTSIRRRRGKGASSMDA
jgi:asparagine synthase (glutamine-hydrolysing)